MSRQTNWRCSSSLCHVNWTSKRKRALSYSLFIQKSSNVNVKTKKAHYWRLKKWRIWVNEWLPPYTLHYVFFSEQGKLNQRSAKRWMYILFKFLLNNEFRKDGLCKFIVRLLWAQIRIPGILWRFYVSLMYNVHMNIVLLLSKAFANIIVINSSILLEYSLLSFSLEISCGVLQFLNLFYL